MKSRTDPGTRLYRFSLFVSVILASSVAAAPPTNDKDDEPRAEQLALAVEAFEDRGAKYALIVEPWTRETVHFFVMSSKTTDADLVGLPDLPFRFGLSLTSSNVTGIGLKELSDLRNLASLNLEGCQQRGELKELKDFKYLTCLHLDWPEVNTAQLRELRQCKHLVSLSLWNSKLNDAQLEEIGELKNLAYLNLGQNDIGDAGISQLNRLKSLEELNLSFTKITSAGCEKLKGFERLRSLILPWTRVGDAGMKELKQMKKMESLVIHGANITEKGLKELRECRSLRKLEVGGFNVMEAEFTQIVEMSNLTALELQSTEVTDDWLPMLKRLKNLESLNLSFTEVTDVGLAHLKELKKLKTLDLVCVEVTDDGLKELSEIKSLTTLNLGSANISRITEAGLERIQKALPGCRVDCQLFLPQAAFVAEQKKKKKKNKKIENKPVSATDLMDEYGVGHRAFNAKYKDTSVVVEGRVLYLQPRSNYRVVALADESGEPESRGMAALYVVFTPEMAELRPGHRIRVEGTCHGRELRGCKLLKMLSNDYPPSKAAKDDIKLLQGKWKVTRLELGGEKIDVSMLSVPYDEIQIEGYQMILTRAGTCQLYDGGEHFGITVDPSKKPKTMDLTDSENHVDLCIYSLDEGKLTIVIGSGHEDPKEDKRPTSFDQKTGLFIIAERVKKD